MECIEPDDATDDATEADQSEPDLSEEDLTDSHPDDADDAGSGFERWRRDSALGAVGTGVARGLQSIFAPPANQPVIVASVPGNPPGEDERLRVILDPDDPTKSVAIMPTHAERAEHDEHGEHDDSAEHDEHGEHDDSAETDEPGGNASPS